MASRLTATPEEVDLSEIVEKSLRDAVIWDEVKDRLNSSALGLSGRPNSGSVLLGL
jgi:phosphate transport system ATP-binding protein